jgi:hypothetical protein
VKVTIHISYWNKVSMTVYRQFINDRYNFLGKYHIFSSENMKTRSACTEGTESYRWVWNMHVQVVQMHAYQRQCEMSSPHHKSSQCTIQTVVDYKGVWIRETRLLYIENEDTYLLNRNFWRIFSHYINGVFKVTSQNIIILYVQILYIFYK